MSAIENSTQSYHLATERSAGRAALPAFSFNPGASLPADPLAPAMSPPLSPQSPRVLPSGDRPKHGHRRGGSEFVGGRIREGNSIAVMGTSPIKSEFGSSVNLAPPRRGHRRGVSSALSTNDLSLLPPPQQDFSFKGSSAPNSPTDFKRTPAPIPPPAEEPRLEQPPAENTSSKEEDDLPPPKPASRARVGFSDTLEFIPRPLSLVSTDTSSTITARPSHTVSGSHSSLVPGSSPTGRESPASRSRSPSQGPDSRPSTAGAILERAPTLQAEGQNVPPRRRNSIPALVDLTVSTGSEPPTPSPTKSKRWTFFGLDPFAGHGPPSKNRPHSASSAESATRVVSGASSSDLGSDSPAEEHRSKADKKKSKKRKMVKGWAGSILPRKQKDDKRSKYAVRPPTPPASAVALEEDDDAMEIDVQPSPAPPTVLITESPTPPRPTSSRKAEDMSSPMIDLDAALGPFNTPLGNNPEWDAAQRAAGNAGRRRLHSAQGMRGFSGPGMHYHRRAESAPDLPPFEMGPSSIHRFASSSTMADVFEEEEEEVDDDSASRHSKPPTISEQESDNDATPPAVSPAVAPEPPKEPVRSVRRKSSGMSDRDQSSMQSIRAQRSKNSMHESVILEEPAVRFRTHNVFEGGSEASVSPRLSPRQASGTRELPTFQLPAPPAPSAVPTSPYSMSYSSSPRSPMSPDTQRLSTAPSSVHEDNSFRSLLMGEPGPEVRLSVDYDIPSLTSSNSIMTRDSQYPPQARMSQPTLREPRPLSVSSAAYGRRRSSLVSLSRLISSSHGERSKLSMEVPMDAEGESKKTRGSRTKRLGRLVQFWKPKEEGTQTQ